VLSDTLAQMERSGRTIAVFAMLRDKDIAGVVAAIQSRIDCWFVAGIDAPRGADAQLLAQTLRIAQVSGMVTACTSIAAAYAQACDTAAQNDRILVFGSFYTVAAVMQARAARQTPPSA
jgi:dihydrofolate synthase/folylpolyglutamate synthase